MSKPRPIGGGISLPDLRRLWSKVQSAGLDSCWLWTAAHNPDGRGKFVVSRQGKKRCFNVPRVIYWQCYGEPFEKQVLHKCNNASCCNPSHFYLGGDKENRRDSVEAGTQYKGSTHHLAKLSDQQICDIKEKVMAGALGSQLAVEYGVSEKTISNYRRGKSMSSVIAEGFIPDELHGNKGRKRCRKPTQA